MNRRRFIKLSALTGTSATLASCANPDYHLIRFVPEDRLVPGVAVWKPSICPLCPAGCGLTVKVMEGDAEVLRDGKLGVAKMGLAKKLEGDPQHPISQGKLCTRGQAAIEVTYHPDRVGHPLKRAGARGDGKFEEISWDQAISELSKKLDDLAAGSNQRSLAILTAQRHGKRRELIEQFANRFGAGGPLTFEFFSDDVLRRANLLSFGKDQLPTLDLAESRYVISFGADFLGTWNSPVSQNVGYGHMRQGRSGIRGKFVQVEYRMSQTGANADEWVAVKPGTEGVLALGLANAIMKSGLRKAADAGSAGARIEGWAGGLTNYSPQEVEKRTGVSAARVERLAKEMAEQRPALAIVAGAALAQTNGLFTAVAVNALNALLGAVDTPGGIYFPQGRFGMRSKFVEDGRLAVGDQTQVLFVDGANPVFASPKSWAVKDTLMKIPYIVSFGNFIDETSVLSDLILPDHSFLESWVQASPESGAKTAVSTAAAPVMRPLYETRSTPDLLLDLAKQLAKPLNLPWQKFEDMLKDDRPPGPGLDVAAAAGSANAPALLDSEPQFDGDPAQYAFHLLPYASSAFLDGSLAHLPLLQELPDPMSSAVWSSWVEINMQTAERLGIHQGDLVEITSSQGSIRAPAFPSPGIAPDVVAVPVGQGHENYTRYASGRGENVIAILAPVKESQSGELAWAATRVKIGKVADADGRLVLIGGSLREYPGEKVHR
jgi:menaquinone reductase, molybdopterin-binding-like subunit